MLRLLFWTLILLYSGIFSSAEMLPSTNKTVLYFGKKTVIVKAPISDNPGEFIYEYQGALYSLDKSKAALRWCYFFARYNICHITVVDSGGRVTEVPASGVELFTFTPDGHYLAGILTKSHTLVLWDMAHLSQPPKIRELPNMRIDSLQVSLHEICIVGRNGGSFYILLSWPDLSEVETQQSPCVDIQPIRPPN